MLVGPKDSAPTIDSARWVDITPLRDALLPQVPILYTSSFLVGPDRNQVPFEVRIEGREQVAVSGIDGGPPFGFVRVGNIVLLDHKLRPLISQELNEQFGENIVWLSHFKSDMALPTHLGYAALTIHALSLVDLKGKHVLDLGAADGVMGLVARKLGARKVTSVELYKEYEPIYWDHAAENQIDRPVLTFIAADIRKPERFLKQVQDADVVVANIGPYMGDVHLDAIRLLRHLPSAKTFIGGAYLMGEKTMDSPEAISTLFEQGFSANFREVTYMTYMQTFMADRTQG